MTEYVETAEDRKDAQALAAIDADLSALSALKGEAGTVSGYRGSRIIAAIEQEVDGLATERRNIVRRGEERLAAFYGDRARVKRACKALRAQGFAVSLSEPSYESASPHTAKIVEAQASGAPYAFVERNRVAYAFEVEGPRWATRMTKADDSDRLTHTLYVSWGPTDAGAQTEAVGRAIAAAFRAEGLGVEWGGSAADCVEVTTASPKAE